MDNGKELLRQDYLRMARRWRQAREPYIERGGDNRVELAEFEEELCQIHLTILGLVPSGFLTIDESRQWCADVHGEYVNLVLWARGV